MELTNEQKVLLEKTLLHLNSFTLSLIKEFCEDKDIAPARMLVQNMKLCDELEPLIKPYMSEKVLIALEHVKFTTTLGLFAIEEDLSKIVGDSNEDKEI